MPHLAIYPGSEGVDEAKLKIEQWCNHVLDSQEKKLWRLVEASHDIVPLPARITFNLAMIARERILRLVVCPMIIGHDGYLNQDQIMARRGTYTEYDLTIHPATRAECGLRTIFRLLKHVNDLVLSHSQAQNWICGFTLMLMKITHSDYQIDCARLGKLREFSLRGLSSPEISPVTRSAAPSNH